MCALLPPVSASRGRALEGKQPPGSEGAGAESTGAPQAPADVVTAERRPGQTSWGHTWLQEALLSSAE